MGSPRTPPLSGFFKAVFVIRIDRWSYVISLKGIDSCLLIDEHNLIFTEYVETAVY